MSPSTTVVCVCVVVVVVLVVVAAAVVVFGLTCVFPTQRLKLATCSGQTQNVRFIRAARVDWDGFVLVLCTQSKIGGSACTRGHRRRHRQTELVGSRLCNGVCMNGH